MNYKQMIASLMSGIIPFTDQDKSEMKDYASRLVNQGYISVYDQEYICDIIKICNIIYNNAPNVMSPLDDDLYDRLIVLCKRQGILYPIGAPPVVFKESNTSLDIDESSSSSGLKTVIELVPGYQQMYYFKDLTYNQYPVYGDFKRCEKQHGQELFKQRITPHNYDMCGTLDKCKYVLKQDASIDDPSISIFESDFLGKHISQGLVDQNNIALLASLKYDGISVEASIKGDKLISACTRGDIEMNQATDLTPALEGMIFPRATGKVDPNETFGIKFEFIINSRNLAIAANEYQLSYVNPRNAVIGLLGRIDSYKFRDLLIPVPLESSIKITPMDVNTIYPRILELDFLNSYYTRGIDMRYTVIQGTYAEVLYKLKILVEEADALRAYSDFLYDGIVVEYLDPSIRSVLGKTRSVPNYAIAIKFPPMKRTSAFTHYTYSVGQSGVIVPKAHFMPVEFMGQIHDKTTIHSLKRFKELNLKTGDKVNLTLNNDVIVYLSKSKIQSENSNKPESFPTHCPSCGTPLVISESGDSAMCPNFMCQERCIQRLSNMLDKLGIKGIATETIRVLRVYNLMDLLNLTRSYAQKILGNIKGDNVYHIINNDFLEKKFTSYALLGSFGFTGIGSKTWKEILRYITVEGLIRVSDNELNTLISIPGIGTKTINTIRVERCYFKDELNLLLNWINQGRVINEELDTQRRKEVRFSGLRDSVLSMKLYETGEYEPIESSGITNNTDILIVPYRGYQSSTVTKAMNILTKRLKIAGHDYVVKDYQDILQANSLGIKPMVYALDELAAKINLLAR